MFSQKRNRGYQKPSGQPRGDILSLIENALADPRRYEIPNEIASQPAPLSFGALRKAQGRRTIVALRRDSVRRYLQEIGDELGLS
ncbi:MAG TPA: hypothetical protein VM639_12735 [Dongiaceae bacterium]|nr:hypothetical protein [Dongiaceae bacterium]